MSVVEMKFKCSGNLATRLTILLQADRQATLKFMVDRRAFPQAMGAWKDSFVSVNSNQRFMQELNTQGVFNEIVTCKDLGLGRNTRS